MRERHTDTATASDTSIMILLALIWVSEEMISTKPQVFVEGKLMKRLKILAENVN